MLTKKEKNTLNYYNNNAKVWTEERNPDSSSFWKDDIGKFQSYLTKGKIIEIGSASGREAKMFIELGYEYIGTDISSELIKYAKENNPSAKFIQKSIYDFDFPYETFDGFWTAAILLHIPKAQIVEALLNIQKIIKKDGIGFISLKEGDGEAKDSLGRYFSYYRLEEFEKILQLAGMEIIEQNKILQTKKSGLKVDWLKYFVKIN